MCDVGNVFGIGTRQIECDMRYEIRQDHQSLSYDTILA